MVNGIYNLTITNLDEALIAASDSLELELQVGTNEPMSPRLPINSVPFAISANHARNADEAAVAKSLDCEGCVSAAQLGSDVQEALDNALQNIPEGSISIESLDENLKNNIEKISNGVLPNDTKYALSSTVGGDALKATSADLKIASTDKTNGDKIQIGSGTAINIGNAKHAASADSATKATNDAKNRQIDTTYLTKSEASSTYLTSIAKNSIFGGTSINDSQLQQSTVTSWNIQNGTIITEDLHDGAVTSAKIYDGTIATADIADKAITTNKIAGSAVTTDKIADDAVTTTEIKNNTIKNEDLAKEVLVPTAYASFYYDSSYTADDDHLKFTSYYGFTNYQTANTGLYRLYDDTNKPFLNALIQMSFDVPFDYNGNYCIAEIVERQNRLIKIQVYTLSVNSSGKFVKTESWCDEDSGSKIDTRRLNVVVYPAKSTL